MIKKIDHIGIAVRSLEQALPIYRDLLGLELLSREIVPDGTVKVAFFRTGDTKVELLQPLGNPGVEKFLAKRGEGMHHICYETTDIRAEMQRLERAGATLIDQHPRDGAHRMKVAFVHPKSFAGVLVELAQPAATYRDA